MSTTKKTSPITTSTNSLFESILANEAHQATELECQKHANRVGLLFKVLYNRELTTLRNEFESRLSTLIQDVANSIDNELRSTKKDD